MPAAPMPIDELFRLKSLLDLHILDSTPEAEFDDLVQAAALVCGVPISLISLVDAERQWFKANVGLLGATETHRDMAFCAYAIHEDSIFEINDATTDARFIDNALVTGEPKIRFYAGAPLRLSNGANIGTLCVIDRNPRQLSETQRATLSRLAKVAVKALESRRALKLKNEQVNQIVSLSDQISVRESRYRSLYESTPVMMHSIDENGCVINVSNRWLQVMGYERHEVIGKPKTHFLTKASAEYAINVVLPSFFKTGFCNNIAYQMVTKNGRVIDVLLSATLEVTSDDSKRSTLAVIQDITEQKTVFRTNQAWLNAIRSQYIMSATNQQGDIIEVNDAFCVISQYSRADLLGQNHRIINSGHHPDSFFGEMWRCIRNGKPWRGEICNRAKDGTLYWVDSVIVPFLDGNGQVERYVSIRSDITLRKLQQEELRKSKLLLDRAGSIAGVGGWEMDLPSGDLFWSNETCRIHGVEIGYKPSLAEAIEFYAPEAQPVIQLAVEAGMVTGNGWDLELPFIQKRGAKNLGESCRYGRV